MKLRGGDGREGKRRLGKEGGEEGEGGGRRREEERGRI